MKCKDCYWYSDETECICEIGAGEPTEPDADACDCFEEVDD